MSSVSRGSTLLVASETGLYLSLTAGSLFVMNAFLFVVGNTLHLLFALGRQELIFWLQRESCSIEEFLEDMA
jgi:hypothetical protein